MSLTAGEQYLIELINRGRLDPLGEAARYNLDLNAGLPAGTIGTQALQVLAPNAALETAATNHSDWMVANDSFSHGGAGGSNAGDRMQSAGYVFTGTWGWRENLAWLGTTGRIDMEASIAQHHEGLYRSQSHRENTFAAEMREIGIGQVGGSFTYQGTTYNSSMVTEKFAVSGTDVFVTGVAYRDADRDDFYSIGEGRQGLQISGGGSSDTTAGAGGYAIRMAAQDDVAMTVAVGGRIMGHLVVDVSDGNVKLDVVTDAQGREVAHVSSSATLLDGIRHASLLGSADLDLNGQGARNRLNGNGGDNDIRGGGGGDWIHGEDGNDHLFGNRGNDRLYGEDGRDLLNGHSGRDRLWGGAGDDRMDGGNGKDVLKGGGGDDTMFGGRHRDILKGGAGDDVLNGGHGNDVLRGNGGADTFVFDQGRDRIKDFRDNVDTIVIDADLARGQSVADILDDASISHGRAILDFGHGDVLIIDHVDNLNILANDLIIN
ncbi:CAP domain-containing protein [Loktanella sp. M215]|uniref:CAP domain-containing protein n=1 Tax=Loktanella sp. M215 TaxID=2675431 RepID=UPI001F453A54|nr:CAP domain-containing protein [Loktanella sp. M215]